MKCFRDHSFSTYAQFSQKRTLSPRTYISFPMYVQFFPPRTCAYQGVSNVSFSENFVYVLNELPLAYFVDITEYMILPTEHNVITWRAMLKHAVFSGHCLLLLTLKTKTRNDVIVLPAKIYLFKVNDVNNNNEGNVFKFNSKDTRAALLMS